MASRQLIFGSLLIGTLINVLLYGFEFAFLCCYLRRGGALTSVRRNRIAIFINFLSDTTCSIAVCVATYSYAVKHWDQASVAPEQRWPTAIILVTTSISISITQLVLLHQFWLMSGQLDALQKRYSASSPRSAALRRWGNYSVATITLLCISAAAAALASHFTDLGNDMQTDIGVDRIILWISSMVTANSVLNAVLIWRTYNIKTLARQQQRLLSSVFITVIDTGIPATVVMTIALLVCATQGKIFMAIVYILGRVGTCAMLFSWVTHANTCSHIEERSEDQASNTSNVLDVLKPMGTTADNGVHNIELGFLSDGHDSIFSHATSLSEIDIERHVQEVAAAQPVDQG